MSEPHFLTGFERTRWKLTEYITDGLRRRGFKRKDDLAEAHFEVGRLLDDFVKETVRRAMAELRLDVPQALAIKEHVERHGVEAQLQGLRDRLTIVEEMAREVRAKINAIEPVVRGPEGLVTGAAQLRERVELLENQLGSIANQLDDWRNGR